MANHTATSACPKIQTFRPTEKQFSEFSNYVKYMESCDAHKAGIAKVIPPLGYVPRMAGYQDINDMTIPSPLLQIAVGTQGSYRLINLPKEQMTVREFHDYTETKHFTPSHVNFAELERKYWKTLLYTNPIYGAGVEGSLMDTTCKLWNVNKLVDSGMGEDNAEYQGPGSTSFLYFGSWKTTFGWHIEDMDLYSIDYLHFGKPRTWYAIPPEYGHAFEQLAQTLFPDKSQKCASLLRHKDIIISPEIVRDNAIPCDKITQESGEFIVTFPFGYHFGFNHGYNCSESNNFATTRWIEYGKRASHCACYDDEVTIDKESFVERFQPEKYDAWMAGNDWGVHPEDDTRRRWPCGKNKQAATNISQDEQISLNASSSNVYEEHNYCSLE